MQIDDWFLDLLIWHEDDPGKFASLCEHAGITDLKVAYNQVRARKELLRTF